MLEGPGYGWGKNQQGNSEEGKVHFNWGPVGLPKQDRAWRDHALRCEKAPVLEPLPPQSAKSSQDSRFSPISDGPFALSASQLYEN